MFRSISLAFLLLSLLGSDAHAQKRNFQYIIAGGVAYPFHNKDFSELWNVGLDVGIGIGYPLSSSLTLIASGEISSMPLDGERFLESAGIESSGSAASEGNVTVLTGAANLKYASARSRSGESVFLTFGAGISRFSAGDVLLSIVEDNITNLSVSEGFSKTTLSFNAGAGFNVHLSGKSYLFMEVRYVMLLMDNPTVHFIPLRMGVAFR